MQLFGILLMLNIASVVTGFTSDVCPEQCSCLQSLHNQSDFKCHFDNLRGWAESCNKLNDFDVTNETSMAVSGDISIFFHDTSCLPNLYNLDLSHVPITNLKKGMFEDISIQYLLNLSHANIHNIQFGSFDGLSHLVKLDLSFNHIKSLDAESLIGLQSLRYLDISFNRLASLHQSSLTHLPLEGLNLAHNLLVAITADHFSSEGQLKTLNLHGNQISTFIIGINDTSLDSLKNIATLDISTNPLECSCVLKEVFNAIPSLKNAMENSDKTVCFSPELLKGQKIMSVTESALKCIIPEVVLSYPARVQSVLLTHTITLECKAEGYPQPTVIWITPWGEMFYNGTTTMVLKKEGRRLNINDDLHSYEEYEEDNVPMTSSIQLLSNDNLMISKFRGCLSGAYQCIAINFAGNHSHDIDLNIISAIKSEYHESLFVGALCSVCLLTIGFLTGLVKMLINRCRNGFCFVVPFHSKAPSEHPPEVSKSSDFDRTSTLTSTKDFDDFCFDKSLTSSPLFSVRIPYSGEGDGESIEGAEAAEDEENRLFMISETMDDHGRTRQGMGNRTLERVRKNVQSFKDSGSGYVYNIKKSGTSAAKSLKDSSSSAAKSISESSSHAASVMKASMVLGAHAVKSHIQSAKELCGTGNLNQTVSMMSVETDVDTLVSTEILVDPDQVLDKISVASAESVKQHTLV